MKTAGNILIKAGITVVMVLLIVIAVAACEQGDEVPAHHVEAAGYEPGNTEDETVVLITEEIGKRYGICPELLQAVVFMESSNNPKADNGKGCLGYMQINPKWHQERMKRLGVDSVYDAYGNIAVGTDYLVELIQEYGDVSDALMVYHGEAGAEEKAGTGEMSIYAEKVLSLSRELEIAHGK